MIRKLLFFGKKGIRNIENRHKTFDTKGKRFVLEKVEEITLAISNRVGGEKYGNSG